jgi:Protein of unknown function (DUF3592)
MIRDHRILLKIVLAFTCWLLIVEGSYLLLQWRQKVPGETVSADLHQSRKGRPSPPALLLSYAYQFDGTRYVSTDLLPLFKSHVLTPEDEITANAWIARYPPGTPLTVSVSRLFPWWSSVASFDDHRAAAGDSLIFFRLAFSVGSFMVLLVLGIGLRQLLARMKNKLGLRTGVT